MALVINTPAHSLARKAARSAASIALADAGSGNSTLRIYTAPSGTLLAVRTLAKPCGVVRVDGRLDLQAGELDEVATNTGAATYAVWCNGAGLAISSGRVTDPSGNITDGTGAVVADPDGVGPFVLGNNGGASVGTMVYAGGLVLLYAGLIG